VGRQCIEHGSARIVLHHMLHITWSMMWHYSHVSVTDKTVCIAK